MGEKDEKTWELYGGGYRLNSFLPCNKKLGKYFTKGLQAGVLATALITGTVGCGNTASGGNEIDNPYTPIPDDQNKDQEQGGNEQFPDCYVTGDYLGQCFIETNADGGNHEYITKRFDSAFADAQKYLNQKVANLQKDLHDKVTPDQIANNEFYKALDTALKNSTNDQKYIGDNVKNNSENFAQYFALMEKPLKTDVETYMKYKCSYYQLSHVAYNRSLGGGCQLLLQWRFPV